MFEPRPIHGAGLGARRTPSPSLASQKTSKTFQFPLQGGAIRRLVRVRSADGKTIPWLAPNGGGGRRASKRVRHGGRADGQIRSFLQSLGSNWRALRDVR